MGLKKLLRVAGFGAAAMYLFDPQCGGRRRAMVRDQLVGGLGSLARSWEATMQDLSNRVTGTVSEIERAWQGRSKGTGEHAQTANEPGSQELAVLAPEKWSPSAQMGAALGGAALVLYGTTFRKPMACFLGSTALGLATAARTCGTSCDSNAEQAGGQSRAESNPQPTATGASHSPVPARFAGTSQEKIK